MGSTSAAHSLSGASTADATSLLAKRSRGWSPTTVASIRGKDAVADLGDPARARCRRALISAHRVRGGVNLIPDGTSAHGSLHAYDPEELAGLAAEGSAARWRRALRKARALQEKEATGRLLDAMQARCVRRIPLLHALLRWERDRKPEQPQRSAV